MLMYVGMGKGMIPDRITIDLDAYAHNFTLKALRAYYQCSRLDVTEEVIIHISTGGKGLHIEAHFNEILSDEERYRIRRTLADDNKRTDLDEQRGAEGHATDIFWSEKAGNDHERERMDGIWAALDRLESTRASDPSKVKALALHGRKAAWDTHGSFDRPSRAEAE